MTNEKVFQMKLKKIYPLLVAKAEKKGRTRSDEYSAPNRPAKRRK